MNQIKVDTSHVKVMTALIGSIKRSLEHEPDFKARQDVCSLISQVLVWHCMGVESRLPAQYHRYVPMLEGVVHPQLFEDTREVLKLVLVPFFLEDMGKLKQTEYVYLVLRTALESFYPNIPVVGIAGNFESMP